MYFQAPAIINKSSNLWISTENTVIFIKMPFTKDFTIQVHIKLRYILRNLKNNNGINIESYSTYNLENTIKYDKFSNNINNGRYKDHLAIKCIIT